MTAGLRFYALLGFCRWPALIFALTFTLWSRVVTPRPMEGGSVLRLDSLIWGNGCARVVAGRGP